MIYTKYGDALFKLTCLTAKSLVNTRELAAGYLGVMEGKFGSIEKARKEGSKKPKGVKNIEILEETITRGRATVRLSTYFEDGTTEKGAIPFIKETGEIFARRLTNSPTPIVPI